MGTLALKFVKMWFQRTLGGSFRLTLYVSIGLVICEFKPTEADTAVIHVRSRVISSRTILYRIESKLMNTNGIFI